MPLAAQVVIANGMVMHRPPMVTVPLPLFERHHDRPYWMVILRARHAVYLKYNQCLDNNGFQRLAARALAVLRRYPGYRLIVDFRGNSGGDTTPFQGLVSGIRARALLISVPSAARSSATPASIACAAAAGRS